MAAGQPAARPNPGIARCEGARLLTQARPRRHRQPNRPATQQTGNPTDRQPNRDGPPLAGAGARRRPGNDQPKRRGLKAATSIWGSSPETISATVLAVLAAEAMPI